MHALDVDVVRAVDTSMELRALAENDNGIGLLAGYFSASDTWYEIDSLWEGKFLERTVHGTFADTIEQDRDGMRVLFDHGFDASVGNKVLGPIRTLEEQKSGPFYEVPLFDTSYNRDLLPGLKEGVYGASFRFRVQEENWLDEPKASKYNPKGIPERTITKARVMEFGPVTFPANPAASAGVRSLTDSYYDRLRQRDLPSYEQAVRAAGPRLDKATTIRSLLDGVLSPEEVENIVASLASKDFTGRSDARSTDGGDAGEPGSNCNSTENLERHRVLRVKGIVK